MLAMSKNRELIIDPMQFILIYFITFSFGVIKLISIISSILYNRIDIVALLSGSNEWVESFYSNKLQSLLQYALSLMSLLFLYLFCFFFYTNNHLQKKIFFLNDKKYLPIIISTFILVNASLFILPKKTLPIILIFWFFSLGSVPFLCFKQYLFQFKKSFYVILLTLIIVQYGLLFKPFIFDNMLIENDYFDIPEKTILNGGHIVDNTEYVNEHRIGGLLKYDPRKDQGKTPAPRNNSYVNLTFNPLIVEFLNRNSTRYHYAYDEQENFLSLNAPMTKNEFNELNNIYLNKMEDKINISYLYYMSLNQSKFYEKRIYSKEEFDFIKKNDIELQNQARAGWQLYHHNYILGPINAIALGANPKKLNMLYGWIDTLAFMKVMQWVGDINYQTYFKVLFSIYPLYFLLVMITIFLIFRQVEYVLIAGFLLSLCIFTIGDQLIRLAPGFNPMRHFFDIFVIYFFYLYLNKNNKIYLALSITIGLFSILWSKDFGLFIFLSLMGATFFKLFAEKKNKILPFLSLAAILSIGLVCYLIPYSGKNPCFIYMLLGIAMPQTPEFLILFVLLSIIFSYAINFVLFNSSDNIKYLSLMLLFYSQLILTYYIWYPSLHHLFATGSIFIFLIISWLYLFKKNSHHHTERWGKFYSILVIILTMFYVPLMFQFYYERMKYNQIFESHLTYRWPVEKIGFVSTMEPNLFLQSSALIKQYEKSNELYLISKYDSFLPILSNKYSALPFIDVPLNLITRKENSLILNQIKKNKPEYIFIDTDINRNFNGDIFNFYDPLGKKNNAESLGRASVLTNLKGLYDEIKNFYQPIKVGKLITVYQKKKLSEGL